MSAIRYFGPDFDLSKIRWVNPRELEERPDDLTLNSFLRACRAGTAPGGRKPNSEATINRKVSSLRTIMKLAVKNERIDAMPSLPKDAKEKNKRVRFLSRDEEQFACELLERSTAVESVFNRADRVTSARDAIEVFQFLTDTGMRWGEFNALLVRHFRAGRVEIYGADEKGTKNDTVRSVKLTRRAADLAVLWCEGKEGHQRIAPLRYEQMEHQVGKVRKVFVLEGYEDFTIHTLRHTCASRLAQGGMDLYKIMDWMGHLSIETTMRYAHLRPSDKDEGADILEAASA